ncbi:galactokinase [Breznakia pachnodae]|uniref:Galactokinase n=1 Tax=Breznakia pachnodae TaxID=265178 RepID=A0ABU0E4S0_9FIRM|nr:galactokinase family protein [Breznakia pachnodae]MDQ0361716.1 galactokinase [Breznakia pachnodae]
MENLYTVIERIEDGFFDKKFEELYVDKAVSERQKERYVSLLNQYHEEFVIDDVSIYSAPGRTEVGGNHTDHQHGRVLAAAVNMDTVAIVSKREDNIVHIISEGFNIKKVDISNLEINEKEAGTSEALIRGVCARIKELGFEVGGFSAYMSSEVLEGAGLSSSAAFEVLIGTIISGEYNDNAIDAVEIAKIGQYSENNYFMKPCGLMDQMASSVGGFITIDFKDPEKPVVEKINYDFDSSKHSLCIVDTKGSHADLTDDYASIPTEMKKVANYFGKDYLREVDINEFYSDITSLRELCGDRSVLRAYHFFNENERVVDQVNALNSKDFDRFKELVKDSGNSSFKYLQNVYTPKDVEEQNLAIALAISEKILTDNGVCRVHGGGFAGTIQAYVPNELLNEYKEAMEKVFGENSCHVLKVRPYGGYQFI